MNIENKANLVIAGIFAAAVVGGIALGRRGEEPAIAAPIAVAAATPTGPPAGTPPPLKHPEIQAAIQALQVNDLNGARAHFEAVDPADPEFVFALHNLGVVYERLGAMEASREAFARLTKLEAHNPEAWVGLGWAHYVNGDPVAAEGATLRALELNPNEVIGRYNLGLFRAAQDKTDDALESYNRAMASEREQARAQGVEMRGIVSALTDLQALTETHPELGAGHFSLALLFHAVNEPAWETQSLERYLQLAADGPLKVRATELRDDAKAAAVKAAPPAQATPSGE